MPNAISVAVFRVVIILGRHALEAWVGLLDFGVCGSATTHAQSGAVAPPSEPAAVEPTFSARPVGSPAQPLASKPPTMRTNVLQSRSVPSFEVPARRPTS
jgi:hypothetical protein